MVTYQCTLKVICVLADYETNFGEGSRLNSSTFFEGSDEEVHFGIRETISWLKIAVYDR